MEFPPIRSEWKLGQFLDTFWTNLTVDHSQNGHIVLFPLSFAIHNSSHLNFNIFIFLYWEFSCKSEMGIENFERKRENFECKNTFETNVFYSFFIVSLMKNYREALVWNCYDSIFHNRIQMQKFGTKFL